MEENRTYNKQSVEQRDKSKGVYVAILNQGHVRAELSYLITDMTHQNKYRLFVAYPAAKPISNNRNQIVRDFLSKPEYDYLMMIDSDIVPPLNILDLVDHQKDVMGAVCFAYMDNAIVPLVLEKIPNLKPGEKPYQVKEVEGTEGLIEVDAIGSGVIVMSRKVLEAVKAPFENKYDENGIKTLGLDLSFCKKAKELGFKVYCHLDFICSHWTPVDLKDIYKALQDKREVRRMAIKTRTKK